MSAQGFKRILYNSTEDKDERFTNQEMITNQDMDSVLTKGSWMLLYGPNVSDIQY